MLLPTFLATIPDHRRPQGRLYALGPLLLFSILAILSDAKSYRKIQRFIQALNGKYGDQYLFGGTASDQPPFTVTTDANGYVTAIAYQGNTNVTQTEIAA